VFITACCVLKFIITFPNYCKCGVNSCVSTTTCLYVKALCYNLLHNFSSLHISMLHFIVIMGPICLGLLLFFYWFFVFVFSLACVYLCFFSPCTFDGWVLILDFFIYMVFSICNKFDVQKTFDFFLSFKKKKIIMFFVVTLFVYCTTHHGWHIDCYCCWLSYSWSSFKRW
jgi:hypothetical protein